ncbi:MAG: hypothetical protein KGJ57_20350 [Sphingomonadales bacterium]|nr:hypothetical protein [Sphingomonadales bacterium]
MVGSTLYDLPMPPKGYRPDRDTADPDGVIKFETEEKARAEDRLRARRLKKAAETYPPVERTSALALARRLEKEAGHMFDPSDTLASKVLYRNGRWLIIGNLWHFVDQFPEWGLWHITLLPKGMWTSADDLQTLKPKTLMSRLRHDLRRAGLADYPGFVFAGLDAEFDVNRQGYDMHYEVILCGPTREPFDLLREKPKYQGACVRAAAYGLPARPRVWIEAIDRATLPHPLTYAIKSHWNHVPTIPTDEGGMRRVSTKGRIPEPHHSAWLMWMDRQKINDLTLCMGMRPTKEGFMLTSRTMHMNEER